MVFDKVWKSKHRRPDKTFGELLSTVEDVEISKTFPTLYKRNAWYLEEAKEAVTNLKKMHAKQIYKPDPTAKISYGETRVSYSKGGQKYSGIGYSDYLVATVDMETFEPYTDAEIVCKILNEMSYWGWPKGLLNTPSCHRPQIYRVV